MSMSTGVDGVMDIEANNQPKQEHSRIRWTTSLDKTLINSLLEHINFVYNIPSFLARSNGGLALLVGVVSSEYVFHSYFLQK